METEQGFYLAELVKLVFALSPIALILVAVTFQRRRQSTRILFWLQLTTGFWLTLALANRLLFAWRGGLFNPKNDHSIEQFRIYLRIGDVTGNLETLFFLAFAILFLMQCRRGISSGGQAANPEL